MSTPVDPRLLKIVAQGSKDPLWFLQVAFPWGEQNTSLARWSGPQFWQAQVLNEIRESLLSPRQKGQHAIASGKGIGKSALVAWLVLWGLTTMPDTKVVVTAGTEPQLRTKTWPEVAKWFNLFLFRDWFHITATSMYAKDITREKTWRADAIPWNANNPEAFAGLHNQGRRILVVFDEASQIHDAIWNTTDGIMSDEDTQVIWAAFGNPTRGSGRFREAFGSLKHRWRQRQIDSRTVSVSDKEQLNQWVEDYGEDSDYVRVNVRGMFPRVGDMQFISNEVAASARKREVMVPLVEPLIMGVDVARFGDDETVICFRKGRDARSVPWIRLRGQDTMQVAAKAAESFKMYKVDAVFVDGGGVGGGVVDRLRQLGVPVREVQFGGKPDRMALDVDAARYANKRAEMWGLMKEWLPGGGIPDWQDLEQQLAGVLYGYRKDLEIQLEKKEDMKKRGESSPDLADALALTFAYTVLPKSDGRMGGGPYADASKPAMASTDYDPFG